MADENQWYLDVLNFLLSKGFRACPVCGQLLVDPRTGEIVLDEETGVIRFGAGPEFAFFVATEEVDTRGMLPVVCSNCGHVMWFNVALLPDRGESAQEQLDLDEHEQRQ